MVWHIVSCLHQMLCFATLLFKNTPEQHCSTGALSSRLQGYFWLFPQGLIFGVFQQQHINNNNNSNSNSNNNNSNNTLIFGLWGAKSIEICGVFLPQRTLQIGLAKTKWRFAGAPCGHHRHHQQPNDSKHLSLDSFVSMFFFAILLWWRIWHRYVSTNRRRYAQKLLHWTIYLRRYLYTVTHRGLCTG